MPKKQDCDWQVCWAAGAKRNMRKRTRVFVSRLRLNQRPVSLVLKILFVFYSSFQFAKTRSISPGTPDLDDDPLNYPQDAISEQ